MRAGAIAITALFVVGCSGVITIGGGSDDDEPQGGEPDGGADEPADCYGWLDQNGVAYQLGPEMPGVASPVTLTTPIAGIQHRYLDAEEPRASFFMACELAAAMVRAAPLLTEREVVEAVDIGVYNYRCIGDGTPPDCPNGISQHAYALAIDFAGFRTADGSTYSVEDDWVIDPDGEETCGAATESDQDAWLHQLICAQKAAGIWNIALTPNYNADHRNHFHVDLTADGDFIERTGSVESAATRIDVGLARD